jgi:hypothetical protein
MEKFIIAPPITYYVPPRVPKDYIVEIVYADGSTKKRRVTNDSPLFLEGPITEVNFRELRARRRSI